MTLKFLMLTMDWSSVSLSEKMKVESEVNALEMEVEFVRKYVFFVTVECSRVDTCFNDKKLS